MPVARASTIIPAPLDQVWACLAEIETWGTRLPGVRAVIRETEGPVGLGSCFLVHGGDPRRAWRYEITAWDAPRRAVWALTEYPSVLGRTVKRAETEVWLEARDDRTLVQAWDHVEPGGLLGWLHALGLLWVQRRRMHRLLVALRTGACGGGP